MPSPILPDTTRLGHPMTAIPPDRTVKVHSRTLRRAMGRDEPLRPFLSDELLFAKQAHLPTVPAKVARSISEAHRTSRAFVFDREASYRVGELCAYAPDLIAEQQEFARCPYPRTWIELDQAALMEAMTDAGLSVFKDPNAEGDERLGFLFTERGIYTASANADMAACWSPLAYRPHQPMTWAQEQAWAHDFGASRMMLDRFLWGSAYEQLGATQRRSLRAQHGLDVLFESGVLPHGGLSTMLQGGGAGDLKTALCAALLLIRPNLTITKSERSPQRKLVRGRPTVFLAHRVVTIRLSPDRLVTRINRACKEARGRASARWHEVRGHYMHNHRAKTADCVHDWNEVEPQRWECARGCGGRRAWRTYPEGRGTAEVGVVTKHYEVRP